MGDSKEIKEIKDGVVMATMRKENNDAKMFCYYIRRSAPLTCLMSQNYCEEGIICLTTKVVVDRPGTFLCSHVNGPSTSSYNIKL